ncbi:MAG TPA: hypothetical protein VL049_28710 [Candidatus Dormibacteraeota bacterium]|nr:hypothetical protein [Candidatus Dormibacteraeota bacterium]
MPASLTEVDLAVPESPAFTALDLTPETVTRPASPRQFAIDVLTGLDPNGNFQAGLALDAVPWLLLRGNDLTIKDYENSLAQRLASRFLLSAATTKGTDSDDTSVKMALGFRLTPIDDGDPRLDQELRRCLKRSVIPQPEDYKTLQEYKVAVERAEVDAEASVEQCHEEAKQRNWNRTAWDLGAAPTWIQKQGTSDQTQWNGATFWSSFAYGFAGTALEKTSQLVLGLRYQLDQETPDPDQHDTFFRQDTLLAGARMRVGRPNLSVSLDGSYLYEDPADRSTRSGFRGALSSNFRIPGDYQVWVNVGVGATVGLGSDDRVFILGALKWGGQTISASQVVGALCAAGADTGICPSATR